MVDPETKTSSFSRHGPAEESLPRRRQRVKISSQLLLLLLLLLPILISLFLLQFLFGVVWFPRVRQLFFCFFCVDPGKTSLMNRHPRKFLVTLLSIPLCHFVNLMSYSSSYLDTFFSCCYYRRECCCFDFNYLDLL